MDFHTLKKKGENNNDPNMDLVLLNATFLFRPDGISLYFGAMTHQKQQFYYSKGPPVTFSFLEDHVDQHNVVLEDTASPMIARDMAQALAGLNPGITLPSTDQQWKILIPLHYQDEGTSQLCIPNQNGGSPLSFHHAFLILSSADSNFQPVASTDPISDAQSLLNQYEQWKLQAQEWQAGQEDPSSPVKSISHHSPAAKVSPTKGKKTTKAKTIRPGYMRVTHKKKPKKGMFGAKK
jgi:hypothetical protein